MCAITEGDYNYDGDSLMSDVTYRDIISSLSTADLAEIIAQQSIFDCSCKDIDCFVRHDCTYGDMCKTCINEFFNEKIVNNSLVVS